MERYYAMVQTKGLHCSLMAICIHAIIILVYPILLSSDSCLNIALWGTTEKYCNGDQVRRMDCIFSCAVHTAGKIRGPRTADETIREPNRETGPCTYFGVGPTSSNLEPFMQEGCVKNRFFRGHVLNLFGSPHQGPFM